MLWNLTAVTVLGLVAPLRLSLSPNGSKVVPRIALEVDMASPPLTLFLPNAHSNVSRAVTPPSFLALHCEIRTIEPDLVRIRLEKHENHHAGERNVEPNGEREACDSAMHREPARQREKERREHHWQRYDGKEYVAA